MKTQLTAHFSIRNVENVEKFREIATRLRKDHGVLFDEMVELYSRVIPTTK